MSSRQDTLFRHLALLQLIPRAARYRATTTLHTLLRDGTHRPFRWSFDASFKSNLPALDIPIEHGVWQLVTDALFNHYALDVEYRSRSKAVRATENTHSA